MTKQLHAFHSDFAANWEQAETQYLSPCRWSPNPPPHVSVQALWRDDALIFRLCSDTPPSRAVNTAQDSPVWEDSCLECFLSADGQHYLNLEGNANAAMLAAFGPDRNNRQRLADMGIPRPRLQAAACGTGWEAVYTVPAETLHLLDVVLHTSQLTAKEEGIEITCLADGALLGFMRTRHLYSLFNNAIGNAIEAVRKLPEPEKRIIGITVERQGGSVVIEVTNYFDGHPSAPGETTKNDRSHHGFGTMSMRYIAESYGGRLTVNTAGELYCLNITIPLPDGF